MNTKRDFDKSTKISTNLLNKDQKLSYLLNRESKYKQTNTTTLPQAPGKDQYALLGKSPFKQSYQTNSQSKLIFDDVKLSKSGANNH